MPSYLHRPAGNQPHTYLHEHVMAIDNGETTINTIHASHHNDHAMRISINSARFINDALTMHDQFSMLPTPRSLVLVATNHPHNSPLQAMIVVVVLLAVATGHEETCPLLSTHTMLGNTISLIDKMIMILCNRICHEP